MNEETVTIILPLPPAVLSPNRPPGSRGGRIKKAMAAKRYRTRAKVAVYCTYCADSEKPWKKAVIQATFFHKHKRRRDDVNHLAMLKPAYDGIVDSGLLVDDDSEHLTTLPALFEIDREYPRVELTLAKIGKEEPRKE